ncbi:MAG TPA: hypothetical protein VF319_01360 [Caldimonas sp.]
MRASPPIDIELNRDGLWHGAVVALVLVTGATWILFGDGTVPIAASAAALGCALVAAALAFSAVRSPGARLRWNGARWQLGQAAGRPGDGVEGDVAVAVDLGAWMLLRFVADAVDGGGVTWLPVRRRGLEARWHALRCAVYSPRSTPGAP